MKAEAEIIRHVSGWGNSAGVLLPKEWLGKEVNVTLIDRTADIKKEVFAILEDYLEDTIGIYLVGSYARGEQNEKSDIDIIVLTNKIDKKIKSGKYNLILISLKKLEYHLEQNILPLLPMLREARPILNPNAIKNYKDTKITRKNLKFHLETTRSALDVINKAIELAEIEESGMSENIVYSLILRLREVYIVDCLREHKIATTKGLLALVKKLAGSDKAHKLYLNAKNDGKESNERISPKEAKNICVYIEKRIKKQEI